ncbi:MAG: metal transporter [Acidobacteria bacterium]|nr:MAG: metal transporter [Acidobacteriota bacterium]REK04396.1 MAG: metal transporter [Acidobacteriota bacterium]
MIDVTLWDPAEARLLRGGPELVQRWRDSRDALIWVATTDEDPATESKLLRETFGLHRHAVADAQRDRHPPKIEAFEGNSFLLLKALDARSQTIDFKTIQLALFVGERFLVTRSSGPSPSVAKTLGELHDGQLPPDTSRAELALRVCRTVCDRFLPALLAVENRLEQMEAEMLDSPTDALLAELVRQKGDLRRMLRILQYHAQIFAEAKGSTPPELAGHKHELIDVLDQLDRHLSLARLYYDVTDDLVNGYLSLSAHRLNQIMQTLTIVTVIFVPITFMAGIYGMNFEYIPELGFRYGYFFLLGAMVLVVAGLLVLLHRRGWLRPAGRAPASARTDHRQ